MNRNENETVVAGTNPYHTKQTHEMDNNSLANVKARERFAVAQDMRK
ncbi:hypothetical protein FACS189492_1960 [Clostridia bacterium]|nr:hypothetical protein FACS189492_1960 [Clostridia bacterium]